LHWVLYRTYRGVQRFSGKWLLWVKRITLRRHLIGRVRQPRRNSVGTFCFMVMLKPHTSTEQRGILDKGRKLPFHLLSSRYSK
jgi:hypothetical protein